MRIINKKEPMEIEVKRFYHPFEIYDECDKCGKEIASWINTDYLSYPELYKPFKINFSCEECDHEWSREIIISMNVKEVTKDEKNNKSNMVR